MARGTTEKESVEKPARSAQATAESSYTCRAMRVKHDLIRFAR